MAMDVDLRHLRAFVAVARHGSFTRAAKAVHISQPTFTVQIRRLETSLGVRLVDRNTRSVQLTPIGRELAPVLERILRDLDSALLNTRALSSRASGFVAIAALPSLSATVLPGIIAAFRHENPGIAIHLRDAVGIKVAGMVRTGEVDFGFGSLPVSEPDVEFTPLFNDRMSAIFPRHSPFGEKRSLSLKDLTASPLILMGRDSSVPRGGGPRVGGYRAPRPTRVRSLVHFDGAGNGRGGFGGYHSAGFGASHGPRPRTDEPADSESQDRPRSRPDSVEGQVAFARRRRIPAGATGAVRGVVCPPKMIYFLLL